MHSQPCAARRWRKRLAGALADDVPLLKRDGGFVRADITANWTRCGRCATNREGDRRAADALCRRDRRPVAEDQVQQRARLFHRGDAAECRRADRHATRPRAEVHPPPDTGERHAFHDDGTGGSGKPHRQCRRPGAGDRAGNLRRELFLAVIGAADAIRDAALALSVIDVSIGTGRTGGSEGYCRPKVDDSRTFEVTAGRHPVVEQALRGRRPIRSSPMTATFLREGVTMAGRDLAADRPEHGRQIDLPAPERADRDPGTDGLLRPAGSAISAWSTGCSAGSAHPMIWRAGARPSWSRWWKRPRSSIRPARIRW
jgi:hypothetical protein